MASFTECLTIGKIQTQYVKRNATLLDFNNTVENVKRLSTTEPKARQFLSLEKEVVSLSAKLKAENALFVQLLLVQNENIASDSKFGADQLSVNTQCFESLSVTDDYRGILEDKKLIKSATDTQESVQNLSLNSVLEKLTENVEKLTAIGKQHSEASKRQADALVIARGPKVKQPEFEPKGDINDYLSYKDFKSKFQYFTKDIIDDKDRLQFLLSSVKGAAYEAIKGLTINQANFAVALNKLDKKYLSDEKIIKSIINNILQYKVVNPDANYNNVLEGLATLDNHLMELHNVHNLNCKIGAADKLISLIIIQNLPSQLRNEIINITGSTFPSLDEIFSNVDEAVRKLNTVNSMVSSYPKPGYDVQVNMLGYEGYVTEDSFDSDSDGESVETDTDSDSESSFEDSDCDEQFSGDEVNDRFAHSTDSPVSNDSLVVRSGSSSVNCFSHSVVLPEMESGQRQRSVALETCVLSVLNKESKFLPVDKRYFSILCDNGAQRSIVTAACAKRLNLKVIRRELAGLQGLGQTNCSVVPYDVVELFVGSPCGSHSIRFDALVVSNLNNIFMPGATNFARKIHAHGYPLADWRFLNHDADFVHSDCILGSDYYRKLVSTQYLPVYLHGMYLTCTVFGSVMLSGKIPGSTKDHPLDPDARHSVSVNILPVVNVDTVEEPFCVSSKVVHSDFNLDELKYGHLIHGSMTQPGLPSTVDPVPCSRILLSVLQLLIGLYFLSAFFIVLPRFDLLANVTEFFPPRDQGYHYHARDPPNFYDILSALGDNFSVAVTWSWGVCLYVILCIYIILHNIKSGLYWFDTAIAVDFIYLLIYLSYLKSDTLMMYIIFCLFWMEHKCLFHLDIKSDFIKLRFDVY